MQYLDGGRWTAGDTDAPQNAAIPAADSGGAALYVLEMASGWFAGRGVRAGDSVDLSAALVGIVAR